MRFLHTADWHLGRLFHGLHLTEDQSVVLDQFVALARDARPDFIIIAGDVYDRALPPPEAVELLDDVLSRLVLDLKVPVIAIAGNHDSPQRLHFGARLLARQGAHVAGVLTADAQPLVFEDGHGPVQVCVLPYAEPAVARGCLACDEIHTHSDAMRALTTRLTQVASRAAGPASCPPANRRRVLVAHAFVAGGRESESERPLTVGGSAAVDGDCFDGFHYVALGHLHFPHSVHREGIHYSGSLMKYSFSEADHRKAINLVEMDAKGNCRIEPITLTPRREVRRIEGYLQSLLDGPADGRSREDYLEITLLDDGAIYDAMGRLRKVYPNVLHVQRAVLAGGGQLDGHRPDHRRIGDCELFTSFFKQVTGQDLSDEQSAAFASTMDKVRRAEREVAV